MKKEIDTQEYAKFQKDSTYFYRIIYCFADSTYTACNVMEVVWNGIVFMFVWNRNVFCCQN